MKSKFKFALLLGLAAVSSTALASDLAILQNGNSIRHDHRRVMGTVTRLYLSTDGESFIDVPSKEIDHVEKDMSPTPAPAALSTPPVTNTNLVCCVCCAMTDGFYSPRVT